MSGTYGYHPKVENPNGIFVQMQSDANKPFYFGASQVPLVLGTEHLRIESDHELKAIKGKGIDHKTRGVDISPNGKIVLPSHIASIKR